MRILVTGGAGYIGSTLVPFLLAGGHKVTVFDNFMHGVPSLAHCCNQRLEIINGDARNPDSVSMLVKRADVIIPLAGIVGMTACDRDQTAATTTNYHAVTMLCSFLSKDQIVIIPTTNSGYGIGGEAECDETSSLKPVSLYGRLKVDAEKAVLDRENSVSLRLATAFGLAPRMRWDLLVNDFVRRAVKDKFVVLFQSHFRRNFIHVRDVAYAFRLTIKRFDHMKGQIYNVGLSNANLTKRQLCDKIKEHIPQFVYLDAPIGEDADKRDYIVSNAKIEATGFKPVYSLDYGIRELIKGCRMLP